VPPLTQSMCTPIGDGSAAVIVCSGQILKKLGDVRPVKVLASVLAQGSGHEMDDEEWSVRLARKSFKTAGLEPQDIDVAEIHDFTAFGELRQTEFLGFCPMGEGGSGGIWRHDSWRPDSNKYERRAREQGLSHCSLGVGSGA